MYVSTIEKLREQQSALKAQIKAEQGKAKKAREAKAKRILNVFKGDAMHDFTTGSKGHRLQSNVTVGGVEYFVQVTIVDKSTVARDEAGKALSSAKASA